MEYNYFRITHRIIVAWKFGESARGSLILFSFFFLYFFISSRIFKTPEFSTSSFIGNWNPYSTPREAPTPVHRATESCSPHCSNPHPFWSFSRSLLHRDFHNCNSCKNLYGHFFCTLCILIWKYFSFLKVRIIEPWIRLQNWRSHCLIKHRTLQIEKKQFVHKIIYNGSILLEKNNLCLHCQSMLFVF
jgi:hypothetical protein